MMTSDDVAGMAFDGDQSRNAIELWPDSTTITLFIEIGGHTAYLPLAADRAWRNDGESDIALTQFLFFISVILIIGAFMLIQTDGYATTSLEVVQVRYSPPDLGARETQLEHPKGRGNIMIF